MYTPAFLPLFLCPYRLQVYSVPRKLFTLMPKHLRCITQQGGAPLNSLFPIYMGDLILAQVAIRLLVHKKKPEARIYDCICSLGALGNKRDVDRVWRRKSSASLDSKKTSSAQIMQFYSTSMYHNNAESSKKRKPITNAFRRLMLSRDLFPCQLFDGILSPIESKVSDTSPWNERSSLENTHMSPKATMQMVCQTPRPTLGATPRYRPLIPFCV
jgi:hypothetical protein